MGLPTTRISENVLFVLLLAAVAGWVTAPAATDLHPASGAGAHVATVPASHGPIRS